LQLLKDIINLLFNIFPSIFYTWPLLFTFCHNEWKASSSVTMTLYRYVKSRSDAQLKDNKSSTDTSSCQPEDSSNGQPIVPCGLIAWSLFNDTYNFSRNNQPLFVNKKDISWKSDRETKFGKDVYPKNFQNGTLRGGASLNTSKPVSISRLLIW
jgi:hypothetical protein